MKRLQIVLITRRLWPLVGGAEMFMANLAEGLTSQNCDCTILTAKWGPSWPERIRFREMAVHRIASSQQRGLGTLQYMRGIRRWLRQHQNNIDVICVSMLKHDAYAAIGTARAIGKPVILRAEGGGDSGDCRWHETARFGGRIRRQCQLADAVVAPSEAICEELCDADFSPERVHYIGNGTFATRPPEPGAKLAARNALKSINVDLRASEDAPIVVYTGRLHAGKGLRDLLLAWSTVIQQFPLAKLWLIGDGEERERLYRIICQQELRHSVFMPGRFDSIDGILTAADLFVLPSYEEGMSLSLLEAMEAGKAVIATDIAANRKLVEHEQTGLLVPLKSPEALAAAMARVIGSDELASKLGKAARSLVHANFTMDQTVKQHRTLFQSLAFS